METKPISKLINECTATSAEIQRMEAMITDLAGEDGRMLKELNVDDETQFRRLSDVRLKRELALTKVPQLQERLEALRQDLRLLLVQAIIGYNAEIDLRIQAAIEKLAENLKPWLADGKKALEHARLISLQMDGPISALRHLKMESSSGDPIRDANRLLAQWDAFYKMA